MGGKTENFPPASQQADTGKVGYAYRGMFMQAMYLKLAKQTVQKACVPCGTREQFRWEGAFSVQFSTHAISRLLKPYSSRVFVISNHSLTLFEFHGKPFFFSLAFLASVTFCSVTVCVQEESGSFSVPHRQMVKTALDLLAKSILQAARAELSSPCHTYRAAAL